MLEIEAFNHSENSESVLEVKNDHKCNLCNKKCITEAKLETHINAVHKGQKKYKCDSCGKAFNHSNSLKSHIKSV